MATSTYSTRLHPFCHQTLYYCQFLAIQRLRYLPKVRQDRFSDWYNNAWIWMEQGLTKRQYHTWNWEKWTIINLQISFLIMRNRNNISTLSTIRQSQYFFLTDWNSWRIKIWLHYNVCFIKIWTTHKNVIVNIFR